MKQKFCTKKFQLNPLDEKLIFEEEKIEDYFTYLFSNSYVRKCKISTRLFPFSFHIFLLKSISDENDDDDNNNSNGSSTICKRMKRSKTRACKSLNRRDFNSIRKTKKKKCERIHIKFECETRYKKIFSKFVMGYII